MCDIAKTCLKQKEKDNKKTRVGVFFLYRKQSDRPMIFDFYQSLAYRVNPTDCFERSEYDFER